jgi:hypothetical protein
MAPTRSFRVVGHLLYYREFSQNNIPSEQKSNARRTTRNCFIRFSSTDFSSPSSQNAGDPAMRGFL